MNRARSGTAPFSRLESVKYYKDEVGEKKYNKL